MRYGILADIHGNLHALRAVLKELEAVRPDRLIVAGDLVGYGAFPNECVELVAGLEAVCVAGNHDLIALGRLPDVRCIPLARQSLSWTRAVLRDEARRFLEGLPLVAAAPGGVLVSHGSLDDPQEYTNRPERAAEQLERLGREGPGAEILVLGHTHRAWCFGTTSGSRRCTVGRPLPLLEGERQLINPGSVGQSREFQRRARFAVLDTEERTIVFHTTSYDFAGCRRSLLRVGLSRRSYHLPPSPIRYGRRMLRKGRERMVDARPSFRRS